MYVWVSIVNHLPWKYTIRVLLHLGGARQRLCQPHLWTLRGLQWGSHLQWVHLKRSLALHVYFSSHLPLSLRGKLLKHVFIKCRTPSQPHRVRQLPQGLPFKRWVRGPFWGGWGSAVDQRCAGFVPGVCTFIYLFFTYFKNVDLTFDLHKTHRWDLIVFLLLFTCSKSCVTSFFVQSPGALAASESTLSITSRPVCLTCAAAAATPATCVSAAPSRSSLDSVHMQEGSRPTGETHIFVVMFPVSVGFSSESANLCIVCIAGFQ